MLNVVPFSGMNLILKKIDELPPHVTINQVRKMRLWIESKEQGQVHDTDFLLLNSMFELGGRIDDICQLRRRDVDLEQKLVTLYMKKVDRNAKITISGDLALQLSLFKDKYKERDPFLGFSRQNAWQRVKKIGEQIGVKKIHPHMFRHGMAIHLLNSGVPIPVISARLGHSNVLTTMQLYLKVTPEIQRQHLEGVSFG